MSAVARPVAVSRYGAARAAQLDDEICLIAQAADGFTLRLPLTLANVWRLSSDLEMLGRTGRRRSGQKGEASPGV